MLVVASGLRPCISLLRIWIDHVFFFESLKIRHFWRAHVPFLSDFWFIQWVLIGFFAGCIDIFCRYSNCGRMLSNVLILSSVTLKNSPRRKLQVYSQIVQSILLHGESQVYSPAQITGFDSLHYKALRQIFQIKSPYHRVLDPSDAPCSN